LAGTTIGLRIKTIEMLGGRIQNVSE